MKLSTHLNYAGGFQEGVREVVEMEKAGLDLVWVAEAYGFDSPSLMGYLAARTSTVEIGASILPIFTRTPTLIAMTDIYHGLLSKIAEEPQRVLRERVSLSIFSKLRIGWRAARIR